MLARFQDCLGSGKVPIVRCGDTDEIDVLFEKLADRVRLAKAPKCRYAIARRPLIGFGAAARTTGHCLQLHFADPKSPVIDAGFMSLLKKRSIRLVEDHPHADHASPKSI